MDSGFWIHGLDSCAGPKLQAGHTYTVIQQKQHIKVTTLCLYVTRQGCERGGYEWGYG